jgi:hypothetical protein
VRKNNGKCERTLVYLTALMLHISELFMSRILPTILFPTHRHPLEQATTEHQSRPFPTDLQAPFTLLL